MPQYREPLRSRMIATMSEVMRVFTGLAGGTGRWSDRVFYTQDDGTPKPLSASWQGNEPWLVKCFLSGLRAASGRHMRAALRLALRDAQEVAV